VFTVYSLTAVLLLAQAQHVCVVNSRRIIV